MEGWKETEIGFIPKEWNTVKFVEIFEIVKSYSFSRNKLTEEETTSKIQNIHYGDIHSKFKNSHLDFDKEDVPFILDEFLTDAQSQYLKDGDIVIADVSEDLIDIGKCVELKNVKNRKVVGGLHTIVARDKNCNIENGFGAFIFKHPEVIKELRLIATGLSVYGISKGNLNRLPIPLPPLPEQRKIAYILSTIQKAIEQQDKLIKTTTELKKALMQKLFTEGLYGEKQKQTEIGPVPESWEVVKLGNIVLKAKGGGTPSTKNPDYWDGDIYWSTSKWLNEEKIFLYNGEKKITAFGLRNSSSNLLPADNLLVSTRVVIGKVAINKIPIAYSQDLTGLWIDKNRFDLRFLAYQIQSSKVNSYLQSLKRGATIQGITREDLLSSLLVLPALEEQQEIGKAFEIFDKRIELHQKKKQTLTDLFKTLLHELMTGQRRVHEIEFENGLEL